jgi:8-oxo-dGTP diphosphatase
MGLRHVRVVAALIAEPSDGTKFLVQQRLPGGSRALLWEFPGGKVEPGETDEAALTRECREELGVELRVGKRLWETVHDYEDLRVELVVYRATLASGFPEPLHAHALAFLTPEQMQRLSFCEADAPLVTELAEGRLGEQTSAVI